ncbi:MAG: Ubiquinone biosynthesis O-methyltransferase, mitochondrial [Syntrophus sp. SKADARSKE-3]|nr:Ubiquinone biosynthesis O-methyltransferase, mitochondrial [Syntrophus sp. SKADARSKE-3]
MKILNNPHPEITIFAKCPYCSFEGVNAFKFHTRYYFRCDACGLIYHHRQNHDSTATLSYYQHGYFDDYAGDQITKKQSGFYRNILLLIEQKIDPGSILDIGCGCGYFLKEASDRNWNTFGLDPSEQSITIAQSLIGNRVLCGTVKNMNNDRLFDAITLINVLDHMSDAFSELDIITSYLKQRGLLYIRVPNGFFHISMLQLFKKSPDFISPYLVFHEYSFTRAFLIRCLTDKGFTNIKIRCAHLSGYDLYSHTGFFSRIAKIFVKNIIWSFVKIVEVISHGRWLLGPSIEITAIKE